MNTPDPSSVLPEPALVSYQTDSTMRTLEVRSYTDDQMREAVALERERAARLLEALQAAERAMGHPAHAFEVLAEDSVVREMMRAAIASYREPA